MIPLLLGLLACDEVGRDMAKAFPIMEKLDEEFAEPAYPCDPPFQSPSARDGIVGELQCGSEVQGNNAGGSTLWGDTFYQKAMCTPAREQYDSSPEDIWRLNIPADLEAEVTLISDCADLDLVGVSWQDDSIPKTEHHIRINQCDMDVGRRGGKLRLNAVGKDWTYLVGVDGKGGQTGNYKLRVRCYTFR